MRIMGDSYSGSVATDSFSCGKDKNDGKKTHNCLNLRRNKELVITKQNIFFCVGQSALGISLSLKEFLVDLKFRIFKHSL